MLRVRVRIKFWFMVRICVIVMFKVSFRIVYEKMKHS